MHTKQCLLDLVGCRISIFPVFQEVWALVLAYKPDEGWDVRLPVCGKTFEIGENGIDPVFSKERDRVLGLFIEIGIKDALIHEISVIADIE